MRHAQTTLNEKRLIQGVRLDPELSINGISQLLPLAEALGAEAPTAVLTSPMRRAVATASAITTANCFPRIRVVKELRERDFAEFEGMSRDDLMEARSSRGWGNSDPTGIFPNDCEVESAHEVARRVIAGLAACEVSPGTKSTVLIVTHAGVIRAVVYLLLGIPHDRPRAFKIQPASYIAVQWFDDLAGELLTIWQNSLK